MTRWVVGGGQVVRQVLSGRSNVFLLSRGDRHLLVDTGRANRWPILAKRLDDLGVRRIDLLALTHTHFDHAENARRVREKYGADVAVHASEAACLASGDSPLPLGTVLVARIGLALLRQRAQAWVQYAGCPSQVRVGNRLDLQPHGFDAHLLHTPGHSRGSIALVASADVAIVGDAMFGVLPWTVFPPFADDASELVESWKRLLDTGCQMFLPAHGGAVERALLEKCYRARKPRSSG